MGICLPQKEKKDSSFESTQRTGAYDNRRAIVDGNVWLHFEEIRTQQIFMYEYVFYFSSKTNEENLHEPAIITNATFIHSKRQQAWIKHFQSILSLSITKPLHINYHISFIPFSSFTSTAQFTSTWLLTIFYSKFSISLNRRLSGSLFCMLSLRSLSNPLSSILIHYRCALCVWRVWKAYTTHQWRTDHIISVCCPKKQRMKKNE